MNLAFADDIAVFGRNGRDLQFNLRVLQEQLPHINMEISPENSKVMGIRKTLVPGDRVIRLEGQELEAVESFKYLGAHIQERSIRLRNKGENSCSREVI